MPRTPDDEIETTRLEHIAAWEPTERRRNLSHFTPGSHGFHEALDRAAFMQSIIDNELMWHPAILNDPVAFRHAQHAFDELWDLYQHLGAQTP